MEENKVLEEMPKNYDPAAIEGPLFEFWYKGGFFRRDAGGYADPVHSVQSISGGMSTSVLAFPGETLTLGEIDFTFREPVEYPGLRIKRVSPALYAGLYFSFALMVIALYLCFFMAPVAVRVEDAGWRVDSPKSQQGLELALQQISDREVNP